MGPAAPPSMTVSSGGLAHGSLMKGGVHPQSLWQPAGPPGCRRLRVLPGQKTVTRMQPGGDDGFTPAFPTLRIVCGFPKGGPRLNEEGVPGFPKHQQWRPGSPGLVLTVGPLLSEGLGAGPLSPAGSLSLLGGSPSPWAGFPHPQEGTPSLGA